MQLESVSQLTNYLAATVKNGLAVAWKGFVVAISALCDLTYYLMEQCAALLLPKASTDLSARTVQSTSASNVDTPQTQRRTLQEWSTELDAQYTEEHLLADLKADAYFAEKEEAQLYKAFISNKVFTDKEFHNLKAMGKCAEKNTLLEVLVAEFRSIREDEQEQKQRVIDAAGDRLTELCNEAHESGAGVVIQFCASMKLNTTQFALPKTVLVNDLEQVLIANGYQSKDYQFKARFGNEFVLKLVTDELLQKAVKEQKNIKIHIEERDEETVVEP